MGLTTNEHEFTRIGAERGKADRGQKSGDRRQGTAGSEVCASVAVALIGVNSWLFVVVLSMDWDGEAQHRVLFEARRRKVVDLLGKREVRQPSENDRITAFDLRDHVQ